MVSEELKSARKKLGYTQKQIAEALDIHPNTWAKWERGEHKIPAIGATAVRLLVEKK